MLELLSELGNDTEEPALKSRLKDAPRLKANTGIAMS